MFAIITFMNTQEIETELKTIRERNNRVENDKAWEVSWVRRFTISIITYIVAAIWLVMIHENNFWLKAFVPVLGYILSTLSLPIIKRYWLNGF